MGDVVAENVGVQMWLPSLSEVEPFDLPDGFALRRYRCSRRNHPATPLATSCSPPRGLGQPAAPSLSPPHHRPAICPPPPHSLCPLPTCLPCSPRHHLRRAGSDEDKKGCTLIWQGAERRLWNDPELTLGDDWFAGGFGTDEALLADRMYFVVAPDGQLVGTTK